MSEKKDVTFQTQIRSVSRSGQMLVRAVLLAAAAILFGPGAFLHSHIPLGACAVFIGIATAIVRMLS